MSEPHFNHEKTLAVCGVLPRAIFAFLAFTVYMLFAAADAQPGKRVMFEGEAATITAVSSSGRTALLTDTGAFHVLGEPVMGETWEGKLEDEL